MTVSLRSTFSLTQLAILMLAVQALADHRPDSTGLHVWRSRDAHARRHTKRSACARAGAPSVASNSGAVSSFTPSSTPSSISPQDPASTGQSDPAIGYNLAGVGHWQVVTTSVWVDGPGTAPSAATASDNDTAPPDTSSSAPPTPGYSSSPASVASDAQSSQMSSGVSTGGGAPSPTTSLSGTAQTNNTSNSTTVASPASPSSTPSSGVGSPPSASSNKHVFAHFMVGIVSTYQQSDWEADMRLAKSKEITGFALNIGVDPYSQAQLDLAYAAANVVDFDLFISFDFNWYKTSDVSGVATMFKRYASNPKQLKVDGKPFVSTFIGDGFDWAEVEKEMGMEIYSMPFYQPSQATADTSSLSGLFSWAAWPGQLDNQPVLSNMTTDRDLTYMGYTEAANKQYMAPVSPWFFTHFGKEVPYAKNWLFYSETLWYDRWEQILKLGNRLNFLEIVTWNDYGESHYIGPYDTPHTDDGSSKWAAGLDHTAHLDFAVPYIKAFKAGLPAPVIEQDMMVYWYRPHLKNVNCDSTDNCLGRPTGWDFVQDVVFVATLTRSGGSFTVTSGSNPPVSHTAGPGVQIFQVPMGVGSQTFQFEADGKKGSDTPNITISAECWNGIYNYNYHASKIIL